jgi:hypothetical protein
VDRTKLSRRKGVYEHVAAGGQGCGGGGTRHPSAGECPPEQGDVDRTATTPNSRCAEARQEKGRRMTSCSRPALLPSPRARRSMGSWAGAEVGAREAA